MLLPSKELTKEIIAEGGKVIGYAQRVLRLTETQTEHTALIEKQAATIERLVADMTALRDEMQAMLAREDKVVLRAELAAAQAMVGAVSDLSRRVGFIEGVGSKGS